MEIMKFMVSKAQLFAALQAIVPQRLLSTMIGKLAASKVPFVKNGFISVFKSSFPKINMSEALQEDPHSFESFNAFFTRELKPDARPMVEDPKVVVSPADGAVSEAGPISAGRIMQAKNHDYRLDELLPVAKEDWEPYVNGDFATIYLAPSDYHRVHMPMAGRLVKTVYVPGKLYSVNGATAATIPRLFAKNERLIAFFEGENGPFCMVLVGAMIVSGIETVFNGLYRTRPSEILWNYSPLNQQGEEVVFEKGDEFGRFLLGSTVILLTPPDAVKYEGLVPGKVVRCKAPIGEKQ